MAQGLPICWLRQSTPSKPLVATPVSQVAEKCKVASTVTDNIPDSYTQLGSSVTESLSDVASNMAAPMFDQNTVTCLHQALGIDSIMSSIRRLTSQIQRNKEEENDDNCPPTIQIKLDDAESENEDDLDVEDEVTQFGSAFIKNKTAGSVNKSLTDMMNKACTSKADCQTLFKTLEKNRNDQATFHFCWCQQSTV